MKMNRITGIVIAYTLLVVNLSFSFAYAQSPSPVIVPGEYLVRRVPGVSVDVLMDTLRNKLTSKVTLVENLTSEKLLRIRIENTASQNNITLQAEAIEKNSFALSSLGSVDSLEPVVQYRLADLGSDSTLAMVAAADVAKRVGLQNLVLNPLATKRQVIIAVIDTGFFLTHEVFSGLLLPGIDVTDDGQQKPTNDDPARARRLSNGAIETHGTRTAGMIALMIRGGKINGHPIANVKILPIRAATSTPDDQRISSTSAIKAFTEAIKSKAEVINVSWGDDGESAELKNKFAEADAAQAIIFAAAGNGRKKDFFSPSIGYDIDLEKSHIFPASWKLPNLVSVAALDGSEQLAKFSNWGHKSVHLGAPGEAIFAPTPNFSENGEISSGYQASSGTSIATPIVAAIAAIYLSLHTDSSPRNVARLISTKVEKNSSFVKRLISEGRLSGLKMSENDTVGLPSVASGADLFNLKPWTPESESISRGLIPIGPQTQRTEGVVLKGLDADGDSVKTDNIKEFLVRMKPNQDIEKAVSNLPFLTGAVRSTKRVEKDLFAVELNAPSGPRIAKEAISKQPGVVSIELAPSYRLFKE